MRKITIALLAIVLLFSFNGEKILTFSEMGSNSYAVAQSKIFFERYVKQNTAEFFLKSQGMNCNIWIESDLANDLSTDESEDMAQRIDSIYLKMTKDIFNHKNSWGDIDNDGRVNILLCDLSLKGTSGYYSADDLLDTQNSNNLDIIYMDFSLTLGQADFRQNHGISFNSTFAHEFQHMLFDIACGGNTSDLWLNESLSALAAYLYSDDSKKYLDDRLFDYFLLDYGTQNGLLFVKFGTLKLREYLMSMLLGVYIYEQNQSIFLDIYAQFQNGIYGKAALVNTLKHFKSFQEVYESFIIATYFDGLTGAVDQFTLAYQITLKNGNPLTSTYVTPSYVVDKPTYVTRSTNTFKLTSSASAGEIIKVTITVEGVSDTLYIYVFTPPTNLSYATSSPSSAFTLVSNVTILDDEYDFSKVCRSLNSTGTTYKPSNPITYATNSGTISNIGLWKAVANVAGNTDFTVTYKISNTYMGRVFASDFVYPVTYKMPNYIYNATQLKAMSGSNNYVIRNSITLSGTWTPLATFSGKLNGKNYTISNLSMSISADKFTSTQYYGLFKINNGTISNVKLSNVTINSSSYHGGSWVMAGSIAGQNGGTISNCTVAGYLYLHRRESAAGGLIGENSGTIEKCTNNVYVYSNRDAGGIAGKNFSSGKIIDCTNFADIDYYHCGTNGAIGGIVGYNSGTVKTAINYGWITYVKPFEYDWSLAPMMGEIIGWNQGGTSYEDSTCYAWGYIDDYELRHIWEEYWLFGWHTKNHHYQDQYSAAGNGWKVGRNS